MHTPLAATAIAAFLAAGCAGAPEVTPTPTAPAGRDVPATPVPATPEVTPSGPFTAATVELRPSAGDPVAVAVHVAADPATRARGLMGREELPHGTGMLFLFPEDTEGAFWMKDTLVPLSIAFADAGGRIVRVLDMEPCEADPCPVYRPETAYRVALEVPRGYLDEVGAGEGDELVLPAGLPDPR